MAEEGGQPWSENIEQDALWQAVEAKEERQTERQAEFDAGLRAADHARWEQAVKERQAAYNYLHSTDHYGGRQLRVPEGRVQNAHHVYNRSSPHSQHRSRHGRRQSRSYTRPTSGSSGRWASGHGWGSGTDEERGFFAGLLHVFIDLWNR
jgi:hypothetical protein